MILSTTPRPLPGRVTLDQLVQRNAARVPDALAIQDAPDRPLWTEGAPRRLTWAQVDSAASAAAGRLVELGLGTDAVVAIQGPTSSDTLLALLACLRANLIPAMLPAGWRKAEACGALARVGARAIFAAARAGPASPIDEMRYVAADLFSVRFVCGFGTDTPDGVVSFEDCVGPAHRLEPPRPRRLGNGAEHVAIVTFDSASAGSFPVARTHNEWISAGLCVVSEVGIGPESILLSTLSPCTFAGLATGLVPWLLCGGTLVLHQAFDATVLDVQISRQGATHLVLPRAALEAAQGDGLLSSSLRGIVAIARRPDLQAPPVECGAPVCELAAFGEIGLVPLLRSREGRGLLPFGTINAPRCVEDAPEIIETGVTAGGFLALRGAMAPRSPFPGIEREGRFPLEGDGWVATGIPAKVEDGRLIPMGAKPGVATLGGHGLPLDGVERLFDGAPGVSRTCAAVVDDPVLGQRLRVDGVDETGTRSEAALLAEHARAKGASPLVTGAIEKAESRRDGGHQLAGAA